MTKQEAMIASKNSTINMTSLSADSSLCVLVSVHDLSLVPLSLVSPSPSSTNTSSSASAALSPQIVGSKSDSVIGVVCLPISSVVLQGRGQGAAGAGPGKKMTTLHPPSWVDVASTNTRSSSGGNSASVTSADSSPASIEEGSLDVSIAVIKSQQRQQGQGQEVHVRNDDDDSGNDGSDINSHYRPSDLGLGSLLVW